MSCAVAVAVIDLAFPYITRVSMQTLLPEKLYTTFFVIMAAMFAAYILKGFMYYLITVLGHSMGVYIEADMRHAVFNHMQKLSFSFFDRNRTGVLMSRITSDLFEITELAHHGPEDILISVLTIIGSLIVLAGIEWRLALVLAVCLPLLIMFTLSRRVSMKKANIEVKRQDRGDKRRHRVRHLRHPHRQGLRQRGGRGREVRRRQRALQGRAQPLFQGHGRLHERHGVHHQRHAGPGRRRGRRAHHGRAHGLCGPRHLLALRLHLRDPGAQLASFSEVYMQGTAGFSRFLELMRTEPDVQDAPDAIELKNVRGEVEYRDVSFSYNDEAGPVLEHVSLKIAPGEKLAVVGPSGGGKTTLCQLLPRFYDVTGGAVLVDGIDVRHVTQESLRRSIGIIQQDVFIFAGTIRENIRYGRPDATDAEVVAAAVRAEIHQEIMAMPDGYDSYVGERGVMLSGGQKQRLSIARVFLKNPPILVMDEATSALDTVTEQRIQASLDELAEGRTSIIIAHRLSTIHGADRIAVIEDERVQELGTHEELMAKNGVYAGLYRAQTFTEDNDV